jgi:hypothetical protein
MWVQDIDNLYRNSRFPYLNLVRGRLHLKKIHVQNVYSNSLWYGFTVL